MKEEEWLRICQERGALWSHDGHPSRPHALLRSGLHPDGFMDCKKILGDGTLRIQVATDLIELAAANGINLRDIDVVVGPATGATLLAESMAAHIAHRRGGFCRWASPEKEELEGGELIMVLKDSQHTVSEGDTALVVEDVCTTVGSVNRTITAIEKKGGTVLPVILVILNRSGLKSSGNRVI